MNLYFTFKSRDTLSISHVLSFSLSKYIETEYGTLRKIRNGSFKEIDVAVHFL